MKKLTFYYYAETYIDFTNLVGDLFKVWKTRIWMSGVNPASFAAAHNPNATIGPGPGAVTSSNEPAGYNPLGSRPRRQPVQQSSHTPQQGMYTQQGGLMYWIPPPEMGSAPVCLGSAISPEEAANAVQARTQQRPTPPGSANPNMGVSGTMNPSMMSSYSTFGAPNPPYANYSATSMMPRPQYQNFGYAGMPSMTTPAATNAAGSHQVQATASEFIPRNSELHTGRIDNPTGRMDHMYDQTRSSPSQQAPLQQQQQQQAPIGANRVGH
jgi:hypothetical protein